MRSPSASCLGLLLFLLCAACAQWAGASEYTISAREGELTTLMYNTLAAADSSLIGVATMAVNRSGVRWPSSQAFGRGVQSGQLMTLGASCTNMNTMYELLTSAALVKLYQDTQFTTSIDDPIDSSLCPNGIPIINPTTNVAVTYRQVMQHTSTITDANFNSYTRTTPATVSTLNAFVEAYFTTGSGGVLQTGIFSNKEPGSPSAYQFARANTALVAYIINRVITDYGLAYTGVADYVSQNLIQPMGLSSTFFLQEDGTAAGVIAPPSFTGTFAGVDASDVSNYAAYYSKCIIDQDSATSGVLITPAFVSDYMVYTTASDIGRLVFSLFLSTQLRWTTLANELRSVFVISTGSGRVASQTATGLGLMYFDGAAICEVMYTNNLLTNCPLANLTTVYGYVTSRDKVQQGFICSDESKIGPMCVVNTMLYRASSTRDTTAFMAMAAATFQDLTGNPYASTGATLVAPEDKDEWFGVYVFLGVYGTLVVVYLVTKLIIYWGLQISIAANTNTGGAAQLATPKRQSVLD